MLNSKESGIYFHLYNKRNRVRYAYQVKSLWIIWYLFANVLVQSWKTSDFTLRHNKQIDFYWLNKYTLSWVSLLLCCWCARVYRAEGWWQRFVGVLCDYSWCGNSVASSGQDFSAGQGKATNCEYISFCPSRWTSTRHMWKILINRSVWFVEEKSRFLFSLETQTRRE